MPAPAHPHTSRLRARIFEQAHTGNSKYAEEPVCTRAPGTPAGPRTSAGSLGHDVQLALGLTPRLLQLTLGAVGDAVGAADLEGRCQCGGCGPFPAACPRGRAGPHRAPQGALAAEATDTGPVFGVLVPDTAALQAQLLLTFAVLPGAGAS